MERNAGTTIFGRLELIREEPSTVGVQVFGPTWAVLDGETGELARACVLDAELLPDDQRRAAFVAGVEALTSLRDPTLVPQLYVGADEHGGAVLYEPLAGGVSFDDLYDGTGSFDLAAEVGRLARQLARALATLHARGQVHGMLTSACVFVGSRGPAVYQYGLAPLCDRAVLLRRVRAFGLPNLAPEVIAGGDFTPAADLYSWAITVVQFAAGTRGAAAVEVARGVQDLPGLTPALRAVVQTCLTDDPAVRPRDGGELLRLIEAAGLGDSSAALIRPEDLGSPVSEDSTLPDDASSIFDAPEPSPRREPASSEPAPSHTAPASTPAVAPSVSAPAVTPAATPVVAIPQAPATPVGPPLRPAAPSAPLTPVGPPVRPSGPPVTGLPPAPVLPGPPSVLSAPSVPSVPSLAPTLAPTLTPIPTPTLTPVGPPSLPRPPIPPPRSVAKDRPPTIPPAGSSVTSSSPPSGMTLPVTSFEEMLMTGDRARRPATIPPSSAGASNPGGSSSSPAESTRGMIELSPEDLLNESGGWTKGGLPSGKSASNLRRVRVLTDPVKRGPDGNPIPAGTPAAGAEEVLEARPERFVPTPSGEMIIGGTREELEAASKATTVRLDPTSAAAAVRAATEAAAASAAGMSGAGMSGSGMSGSDVSLTGLTDAAISSPGIITPPSSDAPAAATRTASAADPSDQGAAGSRSGDAASGVPVAHESTSARRSGAVAAASSEQGGAPASSGSMSRRRSSAVSTAGLSEPRDWGKIPSIEEVAPAKPAAVEVARKDNLPAVQGSKVPQMLPVLVLVAVGLIIIIFVLT